MNTIIILSSILVGCLGITLSISLTGLSLAMLGDAIENKFCKGEPFATITLGDTVSPLGFRHAFTLMSVCALSWAGTVWLIHFGITLT